MTNRKVAVITGSTRGIGYGIAKSLAGEGYNIILNGRTSADTISGHLNEIEAKGVEAGYFMGDISNKADRSGLYEYTLNKFGRIDVLINNAGIAPKERLDLLDVTEESFNYLINTNLTGTFFISQIFAKYMLMQMTKEIKDYSPKIINISSVSAEFVSVNRGEYCISKAGISMMTQLFAARLAEEGINVYEIRPGIIQTDMTKGVTEKYNELIKNGLVPIKRWGQPQDVANVVVSICSGLLDFATGQIINCDGGLHIRRL